MGADIKWEGLDKLQENLEKAATLDDIKRVVRHQEKNLIETASKHAVKASEGGVFAGGYSGVEQSLGNIKNNLKTDLYEEGLAVGIGTTAEHAAYVEYGTRHMPPEPFMEPTAREAGEKFVRDLRKLFK